MANITLSPNMSLPVPTVSVDPGPDWANNINSSLSILDQHNHASGSGVQITQAGISLNATTSTFDSLSFNSSNAYALRSVRFTPQAAALALATDLGCVYESGVDLYYNDGAGNQIRLTQGGSIVGTAGSISGLPSGTASASYSAGTFVFQSATNTAANIDAGSLIVRQVLASANGVTISSPNSLASNYALTLFTALPGSTSIVTVDNSGNLGTSPATITATTINATTGNITTVNASQVNATTGLLLGSGLNSVALVEQTVNSVACLEISRPLLINFATAGVILRDYSANTLGVYNSGLTIGYPAVVSAPPSTNGLKIVRGYVDAAGESPGIGTSFGEGWTASLTVSTYTITFTTAFLDFPVITATSGNVAGPFFCGVVTAPSTTSFQIQIRDNAGTARTAPFYFIAIGQRV